MYSVESFHSSSSKANAFLPTKSAASFAHATTSRRKYPTQIQALQNRDPKDPDVVAATNSAVNGTKATTSTTDKQEWDWNTTSGRSIGSLLMEMQKQEEELRSSTGKGEEDSFQAETLDAGNLKSSTASSSSNNNKNKKEKEKKVVTKTKSNGKEIKTTAVGSNNNNNYDDDYMDQDGDDYDDNMSPTREKLSSLDSATARELDDAVTWMVSTPSAREELLDSMSVVPLPSLYASSPLYNTVTTRSNQTTTPGNTKKGGPLRMPEHYFERISRDMRHLAVSIASSIEDVDQWRTFCQEGNGGLMPLLECIREGARFINLQKHFLAQKRGPSNMEGGVFLEQHEETFMAACSACRALRDLCAVSPELSAVITDGILRANAAWSTTTTSTTHRSQEFNNYKEEEAERGRQVHQFGNNLMHDFMTMLRYANEYSEPTDSSQKASNNPFRRNRNRRGKSAVLLKALGNDQIMSRNGPVCCAHFLNLFRMSLMAG